ncbi:MAG: TIM barrel protein [Bacillota bacterium]|nr:TIM barrel protein [Bacillota bacterium]
MRLSLCTEMLFGGLSLTEALERLRPTPFRLIEFWGWSKKDLAALVVFMERDGFEVSAFVTEGGSLVDPAGHDDWLRGLEAALRTADTLRVPALITQTGQDTGAARGQQFDAMVDCLRRAQPMLADAGVRLLIEPLNTRIDHVGYYLSTSSDALALMEAVNHPNVRLLFDIYHQQITEGDVIRHLTELLPFVGHLHLAGNPGRHEPWIGELNPVGILEAIHAAGYRGPVGLEYAPLGDPIEGLVGFAASLSGLLARPEGAGQTSFA